MHVSRTFAAAALAGVGTLLGVAAPLGVADDMSNTGPSNIIVMPASVKQGGMLTVTVDGTTCRGTGKAYDAIVESQAFPRTPLKGMATLGASYATPQIFPAVKPGTYHTTATCGGKTVTGGRFTVVAATGAATDAGASSSTPARSGLPAMPPKGVKADLSVARRSMGSTETALGATAFAAAVAATGVYLIRRRAFGKA
ncbi:MAG: hypothetical protein JO362_18340 [Streptomycetaceae bacterium]|nr:hypothetical protein [Streptomycetaceae bacterium]